MPEDVSKRIDVTFGTGLPLGTHASFRHQGEIWIAFPAAKNARILSIIDRMLGIFTRVTTDMVRIINDHPEDTPRIVKILEYADQGRKLQSDIANDKVEAATQ